MKRRKNDTADAETICEALTRPTMRFVPVKSPERQGVIMLHRTRLVLTHQRTQLPKAIRRHMAEFGLPAATGREGLASAMPHGAPEQEEGVQLGAPDRFAPLSEIIQVQVD